MPEQPNAPPPRLHIRQQNVDHSMVATQHLINSDLHRQYDLIALQEPYLDTYGNTRASRYWRVVYPSTHMSPNNRTRSAILINSALSTNTWQQIPFDSPDVTIIQLTGAFSQLTLFNIYNDGEHDNTLHKPANFHRQNHARLTPTTNSHIIWLGDFNRHHPYWDKLTDHRLFTTASIEESCAYLLSRVRVTLPCCYCDTRLW